MPRKRKKKVSKKLRTGAVSDVLDLPAQLNNLALFAGSGGLEQGGHRTGRINTVGYVEKDEYAAGCLMSRIRTGDIPDAPIHNDVKTFDGRPWRGLLDCISGGFPCTDVSFAGKRAGVKVGTRSGLWSEFCRIIDEAQPGFVLIENVSGLLSSHNVFCAFCRDGEGQLPKDKELRGDEDTRKLCATCERPVDNGAERLVWAMGRILGDLAEIGYDAQWYCLSAADVGANHRRDRIWIIAWRRGVPNAQLEPVR